MNDDKISAKVSADDKAKVNETIESALKWMEANQLAEKEEFEHKLKEIEKICSPVMAKLYGGEGGPSGAGGPGGAGGAGGKAGKSGGPTIEEVD